MSVGLIITNTLQIYKIFLITAKHIIKYFNKYVVKHVYPLESVSFKELFVNYLLRHSFFILFYLNLHTNVLL